MGSVHSLSQFEKRVESQGQAHLGARLFLLELLIAVLEVAGFDRALSALEGTQPTAREFALRIGTRPGLEPLQLGGLEATKQFVFESQPELERAGVALSRRAADLLTVDAATGVHLGGDDVQPTVGSHVDVQVDVGPSTGHVRRDGDSSRLTGLRHDFGLLFEEERVENVTRDAAFSQALAQ